MARIVILSFGIFASFLSLSGLFGSSIAWGDEPIDFGRQIQPILSENCFHCHGPDPKNRSADLRLDTFEGGTESGAIVPTKPDESELVKRIESLDAELQMPPPDSQRSLTAEQKSLLKKWIEQGAHYSQHWAFTPPQLPAVPAFDSQSLANAPSPVVIRNPIDAFVLAKLRQEGLWPSPEADRAKLLRRLSLDLTGLPPTAAELDAFLQDPSEFAYENAVERLLQSQRYGERMVWEWLDAARYADTNGYQGDPTRAMWYWRDWAIKAFNNNMPFDRFTMEQIAGDLLENPTQDQWIATGFHRNHMINGEGGRIAEESRVEYVQDRVETTGTVWLGLTLTCCRCHDHKYDPFSQKQYYQLSAYFNSIDESGANDAGGLANPIMTLSDESQNKRLEELRREESERRQLREMLEKELASQQPAWEEQLRQSLATPQETSWETLKPQSALSSQGATLTVQEDGSILASGTLTETDEYTLTLPNPGRPFTAIRLETMNDDSLVNQGPGRADNGNFVLTSIELSVGGNKAEFSSATADFQQSGWSAQGAIDNDPASGWAVMPRFGQPHWLLLPLKAPLASTAVGQATTANDSTVAGSLEFHLKFGFGRAHTLGKFRIVATTLPTASLLPLSDAQRVALAKTDLSTRTEAEKKEIEQLFLQSQSSWQAAQQNLASTKQAREDFEKALPRTMVMRDRAQLRETFVLLKGSYTAPGEKVEHGVIDTILASPADTPKNRLTLAKWLVDRRNPLTARVTVNRIWQQFFGVGLVKSAEDFGVQGDKPSHPELLDWLAVKFMDEGWDVKQLVRWIVTSHTYRQSAQTNAASMERDPENRLLARGARYRLPSWMIRDQALAVSGLLVEKVGGAPVKGYQPEGIWEEATFGQIRYQQDQGDALYRRSLYQFWRRIAAPTLFFDIANRQNCSVKTGRTNTPLHALVTLNDVTYVEAARNFAEKTLLNGAFTDDSSRIAAMFRTCTSRLPNTDETTILTRRLERLRQHFAGAPEESLKLIKVGESVASSEIQPAELAAWSSLASLLLNLDETLSKE